METSALRISNKFLKKFLDCPCVRRDNKYSAIIYSAFIEPVLYVITYPKSQWITKKVFEHFFFTKPFTFCVSERRISIESFKQKLG